MSIGLIDFYEFDVFRIDVAKRLLLRGSGVVPVTGKTLDILVALVQRHGQVVSRHELMELVWADTSVGDENLTQQISLAMKALGDETSTHRFKVTVSGRGYTFVADVRDGWTDHSAAEIVCPVVPDERDTIAKGPPESRLHTIADGESVRLTPHSTPESDALPKPTWTTSKRWQLALVGLLVAGVSFLSVEGLSGVAGLASHSSLGRAVARSLRRTSDLQFPLRTFFVSIVCTG